MIEFNELVIHSKAASKEGLTLSFGNGINFIELKNRYIYDFLKLKNQTADSGKFIVNGNEFFPINDEQEYALNVFAIRSQVFCLLTCFVINKKDRKLFADDAMSSLKQLKEMPLESDEQKKDKIKSILLNISKFNVGYILYNQNNEVNKTNKDLIEEVINQYKDMMTFIVLEKGIEEVESSIEEVAEEKQFSLDDMPFYDMNTGAYLHETKEPKRKNIVHSSGDNFFIPFLKKDWLLYCLIGLEIALSTFLGLLVPYYYSTNSAVWGILLTVLFLGCLFIELFFVSYSTPFFDKPDEKSESKYLAVRAWEVIFALAGIGLAFGIFFLFKSNNIAIDQEKWADPLIVMGIVVAIINVVIPFFSKYIRKFFKLFKNPNRN